MADIKKPKDIDKKRLFVLSPADLTYVEATSWEDAVTSAKYWISENPDLDPGSMPIIAVGLAQIVAKPMTYIMAPLSSGKPDKEQIS